MSNLLIFVFAVVVALGEAGKYSLQFSIAIIVLVTIQYIVRSSRLEIKTNPLYITLGTIATFLYSFGLYKDSFAQIDYLNILKLPSFFLITFIVFSLLERDFLIYILGILWGSVLYPCLCFFYTLNSPYYWKIAQREFATSVTSIISGGDAELGSSFINSLDSIQSACLALSLSIIVFALYSRYLTKKLFLIYWVSLVLADAIVLILSIIMQARSGLFLALASFLCLLIYIPSFNISIQLDRFAYFLAKTPRNKKFIAVFIVTLLILVLTIPFIRSLIYSNQLVVGDVNIVKSDRDLAGARSYLYIYGIKSILFLLPPSDMQSILVKEFESDAADRTFHNLIIDQYYSSDLLGLLVILFILFPVLFSGFKVIKRLFFSSSLSLIDVLYFNFFIAFMLISMTSSPFKSKYAVIFIISLAFSIRLRYSFRSIF